MLPQWLRTWVLLSVLVGGGANLLAQGTVLFSNLSADAAVTNIVTRDRVVAGTTFTAQLYYAPDFPVEPLGSQMVPNPAARTGFSMPGFFNAGAKTNPVSPPGGFLWMQVRVWESAFGNSYEEAVAANRGALVGTSRMFRVNTSYPGIEPPASLVSAGLKGFYVEPTAPGVKITNFDFVGSDLGFDGVDDVMTIGAAALSVPWTAEFWVLRQDAFDNSAILIGDAATALKLEQYEQVPLARRVGFTRFNVKDYFFGYTAPVGWVHLAFVGSSSDTKLYVNGNLHDLVPATIPLGLGQIGGDINGRYSNHMRGAIDEVRIWRVARTQSQIQQNMNRLVNVRDPNLVAYYTFDDGAGTTVADRSGHGRTGTLNNGPMWDATFPAPVDIPAGASCNVSITFQSVSDPAQHYRIEKTQSLRFPSWAPVPGADDITGFGPITTRFDMGGACLPTGFYRVVSWRVPR